MATKTVTLDPGQSQKVAFTFTPTVAKIHLVSIDGLTGSFEAVAVEIAAAITDAYVYDKYADTTPYWNGYCHLSLNDVHADLAQCASKDTYFGFVLVNNSSIALPFNFLLRQRQWVPPNNYENYDLIPTVAAPIPMAGGEYQADKKLLPGDILQPGQRGFIAVPATWGRRWCYVYCEVTCKGKDIGTWYTGGWGGY